MFWEPDYAASCSCLTHLRVQEEDQEETHCQDTSCPHCNQHLPLNHPLCATLQLLPNGTQSWQQPKLDCNFGAAEVPDGRKLDSCPYHLRLSEARQW
jgi:hypothetical protein